MALSNLIAKINLTQVEQKLAAQHKTQSFPYERTGQFAIVPTIGIIDLLMQRDDSKGITRYALNFWDWNCDNLLEPTVLLESVAALGDALTLDVKQIGSKYYLWLGLNERVDGTNYNAILECRGPLN